MNREQQRKQFKKHKKQLNQTWKEFREQQRYVGFTGTAPQEAGEKNL